MNKAVLPLLLFALAAACGGQTGRADACTVVKRAAPRAAAENLPVLTGRVMDGAELFSTDIEAQLTDQLTKLEAQTSDQVVVVTTPSLGGESIEQYSLRLGNGWGIGHSELRNGVLLVVAPNERKVRIEVGCGLEGLLTNERAKLIIETSLLPLLQQGDYEGAARAGVAEIEQVLRSETGRPKIRQGREGA